jgi:hypothetical protein
VWPVRKFKGETWAKFPSPFVFQASAKRVDYVYSGKLIDWDLLDIISKKHTLKDSVPTSLFADVLETSSLASPVWPCGCCAEASATNSGTPIPILTQ